MINFLNPYLNPVVKCSSVSNDEYKVENLITKDQQQQALGFMAYSVVRPPIELTFHLLCPIKLFYIKIWSKLGSFKSTGFEIHVKGKNEFGVIDFIKVGTCLRLPSHDNGVMFHNENVYVNSDEFMPQENKLAHAIMLHGPDYRKLLNDAKIIQIRICNTEKWCVPVLRKVEIWGLPSKSNSLTIQKEITGRWHLAKTLNSPPLAINNKIYKHIDDDEYDADYAISIKSIKPSLLATASADNDIENGEAFSIPPDFLDELTCNLMQVPIILPSGKRVDLSTLKKCSELDRTWGRNPADPFTTIEFNGICKPMYDAALKSSIDAFLLKNAHRPQINGLPRVLGNLRNIPLRTFYDFPPAKRRRLDNRMRPYLDNSTTTTSNLRYPLNRLHEMASNPYPYRPRELSSTTVLRSSSSSSSPSSSSSSAAATETASSALATALFLSPTPSSSSSSALLVEQPSLLHHALELENSLSTSSVSSSSSSSSSPTSNNNNNNNGNNHNSFKALTPLDTATFNALLKIKRYTQCSKNTSDNGNCMDGTSKYEENCFKCSTDDIRTFYKINKCKHVICRKCLLNYPIHIVCKCGNIFSSSNVSKYHK